MNKEPRAMTVNHRLCRNMLRVARLGLHGGPQRYSVPFRGGGRGQARARVTVFMLLRCMQRQRVWSAAHTRLVLTPPPTSPGIWEFDRSGYWMRHPSSIMVLRIVKSVYRAKPVYSEPNTQETFESVHDSARASTPYSKSHFKLVALALQCYLRHLQAFQYCVYA